MSLVGDMFRQLVRVTLGNHPDAMAHAEGFIGGFEDGVQGLIGGQAAGQAVSARTFIAQGGNVPAQPQRFPMADLGAGYAAHFTAEVSPGRVPNAAAPARSEGMARG